MCFQLYKEIKIRITYVNIYYISHIYIIYMGRGHETRKGIMKGEEQIFREVEKRVRNGIHAIRKQKRD